MGPKGMVFKHGHINEHHKTHNGWSIVRSLILYSYNVLGPCNQTDAACKKTHWFVVYGLLLLGLATHYHLLHT